jgi:NADPH-dependent 2,4-dienoyl-CoA reductase/sulfur reductase-like enzyme/nitrite reductase/ring-hydroxylating ferredoxin subunit
MAKEVMVARVGDLQDGEMKEVVVGETRVLLSRVRGKFQAIGNVCPHYGGYLHEGCLCGGEVSCPWHQSRFNAATGDLLDPPALDALPRFAVRVEGEEVFVAVPEGAPERREPPMAGPNPAAEPRTFVILGAGAAGLMAAQTLREDGFQGRVVLTTTEKSLPYDRPNLSKAYLYGDASLESLPWRPEEFYREHGLEILRQHQVTQVDPAAKTIRFASGAVMAYDALLLATGGAARPLSVPGGGLQNVFTLRSLEDATRIIAAAGQASRAVVVGASFIGMEAAYSLRKRGLQVTVAAPGAVPFARQLGPEIGRVIQGVFEAHGVGFRLGTRVSRLTGEQKVKAVVLDSGETLPADLVVAGVGVKPATEFLQGVDLNPDGSVTVDKYLKAADGLYAAGDIARFPDWRTGEAIRIEHWRLAQQQGRVAAHNMAGKPAEFRAVPFFWSELFEVFPQYVGYTPDWEEIIVQGDLAAKDFVAFYVNRGRIMAACGMQRDAQMAAIAELMRLNKLPAAEEVRGQRDVDFLALVKQLQ